MLANCLYANGDCAEAEAQWQVILQAGGFWAETVAETLEVLKQRRNDDPA